MREVIEYNKAWMPQNTLDVEEIGQVAIEATNDDGFFWYLIINTEDGMTTIASCGPIIPDTFYLPNGFECSLTQIEYKEARISKYISTWLNDTKNKRITQANIIDMSEALDQFRDLKPYLESVLPLGEKEEIDGTD